MRNRIVGAIAKHRGEHGATAVEYAIMASMIAMVIIAAVIFFGSSLSTLFNSAAVSV